MHDVIMNKYVYWIKGDSWSGTVLGRDRLFLKEYTQYGYLTHIATATALFEAYSARRSLVGAVERAFAQGQKGYPPTRLGRAGRRHLQNIYVARLFAEQIAAIEDLGALGWAIQHRKKLGILKRYLDSDIRDVGSFFKEVSDCGDDADVLRLLRLPSLSEVQQLLPEDVFTAIEMPERYKGYGLALRKVAALYRTTAEPDPSALIAPVMDAEEKVHVVIDVGNTGGSMAPSRSDIYVHTYNRIKHRFIVIEALEPFGQIPDEEMPLFYGHHSLKPEHVNLNLLQIAAVATIGCDLADFLLLLEEHGYVL